MTPAETKKAEKSTENGYSGNDALSGFTLAIAILMKNR